LDVRTDEEWDHGYIRNALHVHVGHLKEELGKIPENRPTAVICSVGNHASLASSILRRAGRREIFNVLGGMTAWGRANFPTIDSKY